MRDTSARARERAVTENLFLSFPRRFCATRGNQQTLSFGFARTQNSGDGFPPRARASSDAPTGARDSPARRVRFRARARTFFAPFARERERKGTPREREREKERASSRATLVQKVSETTQDDCCCCSWCAEEKKGEKKPKKVDGGRGGLYYLRCKAKESSTFVHGHKNLPLFFCLLQRRARLWKKKGGFVVGVGKNWLGNFR